MNTLSKEQVIRIHNMLIENTGGLSEKQYVYGAVE